MKQDEIYGVENCERRRDPKKPGMMQIGYNVVGFSKQMNRKNKSGANKLASGSRGMPCGIDIFDENLSSPDEGDNNINVDVDKTSRLLADNSRSRQ